jgi:pilus assembly protein CpaF
MESPEMSFQIILPFLKPISHLLEAETVSEIMVNPDSSVWIEEDGRIQALPGIRFEDGALLAGLEVIANRFGKKLDADSPIMNLRLPDGSRMAALIPPVVNPRPMMTIRKFTSRQFTVADLIRRNMLTHEQARSLAASIQQRENVLISGGTSSGKTTLLNVLAGFIADEERIVVLEDTAELYIRKPHVISAEAQLDTHKSPISFTDLLTAALRHRPDRIIVGEIRGSEARVFLDVLNTGHRGSLTTIHANGAVDALCRLTQLALRSSGNLYFEDVAAECERSIDVVVHIARDGGARCVKEVLRVATRSPEARKLLTAQRIQ